MGAILTGKSFLPGFIREVYTVKSWRFKNGVNVITIAMTVIGTFTNGEVLSRSGTGTLVPS